MKESIMPARILIVDDAPQTRTDLSSLFGGGPYIVDSAEDGLDGLQKGTETAYDLIIADVNMPRMGGLEMIAKLRDGLVNRETPVFVLTTESLRRHASTCEELGASVWIVKPYDPILLKECASEFLGV